MESGEPVGGLALTRPQYWVLSSVVQSFANGHISVCVCVSDLAGVCFNWCAVNASVWSKGVLGALPGRCGARDSRRAIMRVHHYLSCCKNL